MTRTKDFKGQRGGEVLEERRNGRLAARTAAAVLSRTVGVSQEQKQVVNKTSQHAGVRTYETRCYSKGATSTPDKQAGANFDAGINNLTIFYSAP